MFMAAGVLLLGFLQVKAQMTISGTVSDSKKHPLADAVMKAYVSRLDKVSSINDYQELAYDFLRFAKTQKADWLPYYYAAFCNARIGWLMQEDPDKIDFFADKAEEEIKKAQSFIDTGSQKNELSEICTIYQMLNQARVFINPGKIPRKSGRPEKRRGILRRQVITAMTPFL